MRRDILFMLTKEYLRGDGGEQFKDWLAEIRGFGECSEALLEGVILELSKRLHFDGPLDAFSASLLVEYFSHDNVSLIGFLFRDKQYSPTESMRKMRSILEALKDFVKPNGNNGPDSPVTQARILSLTPALP
jgi:hypothetical protein